MGKAVIVWTILAALVLFVGDALGSLVAMLAEAGRRIVQFYSFKNITSRAMKLKYPAPNVDPDDFATRHNIRSIGFAGSGADSSQMNRYSGFYAGFFAKILMRPLLRQPEPYELSGDKMMFPTYRIDRLNLGQRNDVQHAANALYHAFATHPTSKFVVFGTSRGAAVALQAVSILLPEVVEKRVAMLVCEAPFTTVEDVIDARFSPWMARVVRGFLTMFSAYDPEQNRVWSPRACALTFPHLDLPIIVVSSKADTVVPEPQQAHLVELLRERGVRNVHRIELQHSPHSSFTGHNEDDRDLYVNRMFMYYRQYC